MKHSATSSPEGTNVQPLRLQIALDAQEHEGRGDQVTPDPRALAQTYVARGWAPIPVKYLSKQPVGQWSDFRVTSETVHQHFAPSTQNVGVRLGEPSGGVVDVDLDAEETVFLAHRFLPSSDCTFGRKSKPKSHWLFVCPGAKTVQFKAPDGKMLVELRSTGHQTVFPGSVHESGELVEWADDGEPAPVDEQDLAARVGKLAAAALIARCWPSEGGRHAAALALSGALLRQGWSAEDVSRFVEAVAEAAGDDEVEDRVRCVEDTQRKLAEGAPVTGLPTLAETVGDDTAALVAKWLSFGAGCPAWVEEMNQKYFVVNEGGKAVVYGPDHDEALGREILVRYTFEDLKKLYMNEPVLLGYRRDIPIFKDKATAWLQHPQRRQYRGGVVFAPGRDVPADKYNLWQGFGIEPKAGSCDRLRYHLEHVICGGNDQHFEYLMNWLARAVQNPGEQGEVAVVLRGGRGTGKGTVGNALMKVFGQHSVHLTHAKHLTGNFNAHLRDAVFVFADEAFFAGDRAHESVLKGLITEPHITIEAKYQNAVTARNVTHLLMASNEQWVVPAGADERRFFVLDVSDAHAQDTEYFAALHQEMVDGGLAAFLYALLHRDITDFNVRSVPRTSALGDQKRQSLRGPARWLFDCLQMGGIPGDILGVRTDWGQEGVRIEKERAYDSYVAACKRYRERPVAVEQFGKEVKRVLHDCAKTSRARRRSHGWSARSDGGRVYMWEFAPLHECRARVERYLDIEMDWDDGPEVEEEK